MARARKRSRVPEIPVTVRIESLAHDGRGVARVNGKTVFIEGALPNERVSFRYSACHGRFDEGVSEVILEPSPDRVLPRCAHYGVCGGCSLQHLSPDRQIEYKQNWLHDSFEHIGHVTPGRFLEPLTGRHWGYRRKARLTAKYVAKKGRVLVGFREKNGRFVADIKRCDVLHPRLGDLLDALSELIGTLSIYNRLPQIEVAAGDENIALCFRVLDIPTSEDEGRLRAFGQQHDLQIYLQPGGPATVYRLWPELAHLGYRLPEFGIALEFEPHHFTQVNAGINRQMVAHATELLELTQDDQVLDLFCGLGNFSLAMARRAGFVTGVEGERDLVEWAQRNAACNDVVNVCFAVADLAGEFGEQAWTRSSYDKILLDPPRSGALALLPGIAALQARQIVYVSCHPATLARDAGELVNVHGYKLESARAMDMFPHTSHVESIALFVR